MMCSAHVLSATVDLLAMPDSFTWFRNQYDYNCGSAMRVPIPFHLNQNQQLNIAVYKLRGGPLLPDDTCVRASFFTICKPWCTRRGAD